MLKYGTALLALCLFVGQLFAGCGVLLQEPFTFTRAPEENIFGTSWVLKIEGMEDFSSESDARCRGALLALFGQPDYTTKDYENAYSYTLLATNAQDETVVLTVYQGPSGAAVGGFAREGVALQAAQQLQKMIRNATPADFEEVVYYTDTDTKITYGCKDGAPYAEEAQMEVGTTFDLVRQGQEPV